jgi:hypothetical protein
MILEATPYNKRYSGVHQLQVLDITGYQSTELQASGLFVVAYRREDGRLAQLAILYIMDSSEDPEVTHEHFLYPVTNVARDIVYFGPKATPKQISDYLNDWRA